MNIPKHVVLIPDGNRRWARKRGLLPFFGHREGAKIVGKILKAALDLKIPYFTFWGASVDNILKRTPAEVNFLFNIFEIYFKKLAINEYIHKNQIRVDVLGQWRKLFSEKARKATEEVIEKTKNYGNYHLTFLMAYNGLNEMTSAIKQIAKRKSQNPKLKIDEKIIKANLWTKDLPPVDLVIRTGSANEPHLSNGMMMWDTANSQFYFTDILFPDFSPAEFQIAINRYGKTERRMGA